MKNNNVNIDFSEFVRQNWSKILETTPQDPPISKHDEWIKEKEWDEFSKEVIKR